MRTHKFARKTFYVDAVRVSEANIEEVAEWCKGAIQGADTPQPYIQVEVRNPLDDRQTMAFYGDWVLQAGTGFKVYNPKAFDKSFEKVKTLTKEQADAAGIKVPHEPKKLSKAQADAAGIKVPHESKSKRRPIPKAPSNPVLSKEMAEKLKGDAKKPFEVPVVEEVRPLNEKSTEMQMTSDVVFADKAPKEPTVIKHEDDDSINLTRPMKDDTDKLIDEVLRTPLTGDQS